MCEHKIWSNLVYQCNRSFLSACCLLCSCFWFRRTFTLHQSRIVNLTTAIFTIMHESEGYERAVHLFHQEYLPLSVDVEPTDIAASPEFLLVGVRSGHVRAYTTGKSSALVFEFPTVFKTATSIHFIHALDRSAFAPPPWHDRCRSVMTLEIDPETELYMPIVYEKWRQRPPDTRPSSVEYSTIEFGSRKGLK